MTEEEEVNGILWEQRRKELAAEEMYEALEAIKVRIETGSPLGVAWDVLTILSPALKKAEGRI